MLVIEENKVGSSTPTLNIFNSEGELIGTVKDDCCSTAIRFVGKKGFIIKNMTGKGGYIKAGFTSNLKTFINFIYNDSEVMELLKTTSIEVQKQGFNKVVTFVNNGNQGN